MYGICIKSQKSLEWRVAGSLGIEIEKKEQTNQKKCTPNAASRYNSFHRFIIHTAELFHSAFLVLNFSLYSNKDVHSPEL